MKINLPTNGWFHYFAKKIKFRKNTNASRLKPIIARLQSNPRYKLISHSGEKFIAACTLPPVHSLLVIAERKFTVEGILSTSHGKLFVSLSVKDGLESASLGELEQIKLDLLGPVYAVYAYRREFGMEIGFILKCLDDDKYLDTFFGSHL